MKLMWQHEHPESYNMTRNLMDFKISVRRNGQMSEKNTKQWMKRKQLKGVTVYFHEMAFERVQDAAKADGRSKGNWVHNVVIERLRKRIDQ
jgi:hypothetical protein